MLMVSEKMLLRQCERNLIIFRRCRIPCTKDDRSFKKYILVGGLPKAVDTFVKSRNVVEFRSVQNEVHTLYGIDASKYEEEHSRKLKIRRIFDMIPSNLENKKKRVVIKDIENKTWKRTNDYLDEFDYLISSGIALEVKAISKPSYPLVENSGKNLLKLYLNDVGILSGIFIVTISLP